MGENSEVASSFIEIIAGIGSRTGLQPMSLYGLCFFTVFLLFLYTFFIELSALIDKIDSMRTIADIFAFVYGG